jgi:hypothetical protein
MSIGMIGVPGLASGAGVDAVTPSEKDEAPDMIAETKEAIRRSGLSISELSRLSGVSQPQLSRFYRGVRDLTFENGARLCAALGLRLVGKDKAERPAKRPRGAGKGDPGA